MSASESKIRIQFPDFQNPRLFCARVHHSSLTHHDVHYRTVLPTPLRFRSVHWPLRMRRDRRSERQSTDRSSPTRYSADYVHLHILTPLSPTRFLPPSLAQAHQHLSRLTWQRVQHFRSDHCPPQVLSLLSHCVCSSGTFLALGSATMPMLITTASPGLPMPCALACHPLALTRVARLCSSC